MDIIFLVIFTIEASLKIIALGFTGAQTAYLSDGWNRLDFVCVVLSFCTLILTFLPGSIGRVMRTARTARPLRMINKNERIQLVFGALYRSLPAILNVAILAFFFVFRASPIPY